ncbi:50S ribosomal protein L33 [Sporosarcina sp. G11-34]|nr:50S ribosomal protein L33 [Sporosarcina sp. G11-34]MCZ2259229.1 50S ribosomal protein L33 [Sporosarcina sp. G11-34]
MSKKVILSCDVCGSRNYSVPGRKEQSSERLTLKKHCSHCNAHTVHRQTA